MPDNAYTVVGRYPGGKPVVVHVTCDKSMDARRCAVQRIAFEVYEGNIPDGLSPINEAIQTVSDDFDLVVVLSGHVVPEPDHRAGSFIFHGQPETEDGDFHRNVSNERTNP